MIRARQSCGQGSRERSWSVQQIRTALQHAGPTHLGLWSTAAFNSSSSSWPVSAAIAASLWSTSCNRSPLEPRQAQHHEPVSAATMSGRDCRGIGGSFTKVFGQLEDCLWRFFGGKCPTRRWRVAQQQQQQQQQQQLDVERAVFV